MGYRLQKNDDKDYRGYKGNKDIIIFKNLSLSSLSPLYSLFPLPLLPVTSNQSSVARFINYLLFIINYYGACP